MTAIRYIPHDAIDKQRWDQCIRKAFNGNIYACSWYLDIVHPGWDALIEGDYERVMPLTGNRKWGVSYLFQPFFTQQLGVFSVGILNSEILNRFFSAIPKHYRFIQIQLNIHNKPQPENYRLIPNTDYLLDLINRYSGISSHYSSNTRRNLKKAQKAGLTLMKGVEPAKIIQLFRQGKGQEIKHWHEKDYFRLQRLMYQSVYKGMGTLYGVYTVHNELSASAFVLKDKKYLIFLFSAVSPEGRQTGAMTFLIDGVLRENAETNRVFDFEGSNNPQLARFYRGFGAQKVTYYTLEINRFSFPVNKIVSWLKSVDTSPVKPISSTKK